MFTMLLENFELSSFRAAYFVTASIPFVRFVNLFFVQSYLPSKYHLKEFTYIFFLLANHSKQNAFQPMCMFEWGSLRHGHLFAPIFHFYTITSAFPSIEKNVLLVAGRN